MTEPDAQTPPATAEFVSQENTAKGRGKQPGSIKGLTRMGQGRPKGVPNVITRSLRALAGQYTAEAVEAIVAIGRDIETPPAARVMAWREVLDRAHGKAPQAITGADGAPLVPATVVHQHLLMAAEQIVLEAERIPSQIEQNH